MVLSKNNPVANPDNIIQGETYRFTLLTSQLIRMEYSEKGEFEDRPTQTVQNRYFEKVAYDLKDTDDGIEILTDSFHLVYNKEQPFSPKSLYIDMRYNYSNYTNRWYFGQHVDTLKGALRTVDKVDGEAPLEESIISKFGYAPLDDSHSFVFDEDNRIISKEETHTDVYLFAYGRDYMRAVKDFYRVSGSVPTLPRYALGNWWSRYWAYTEESYLKLMDQFEEEKIPLSVSVIDMDWHLTDIPSKYGSSWTGYTWDPNHFPEPERFLDHLHQRDLAVTLNVHPADGIRAFEEPYERVAERLHLNTEIEEPAKFDLMDEKFREAYFKDVHHPLEEQGVDFWWIDWQQGEYGSNDIDPLWLLNHYHFEDRKKREKESLILSRYAGPGSHRYPVGFSGDAVVSWASLRFQPYLTASSSNIGYSWWSHDIGGHHEGVKDEELTLRWFQYGVFSPINRLHSTKNTFSRKEPWNHSATVSQNMGEFLRLRHALIPYLYTYNILTSEEGIPLVQPVYYHYPNEEEAYDVKNEYFFGDELLVLPITSKKDDETLSGSETMYLPEGNWFDIFTNFRYKGGAKLRLYREETAIPVFATEGSIIPLDANPTETNPNEPPRELDWHIYPGKNHSFKLIEDSQEDRCVTEFALNVTNQTITLENKGDLDVIPEKRTHTLHFNASKEVKVTQVKNGRLIKTTFNAELNRTSVTFEVNRNEKAMIAFDQFDIIEEQDIQRELFRRLDKAQVEYTLKDHLWHSFKENPSDYSLLAKLNELKETELSQSLFELLYVKNG